MKKFVIKHDQVPANPTLDFAKLMLERARGCEEIVSIGGGSTIDVGKYISFNLKVPHTAIPTTAGTGAEVTKFVVLTIDGKKTTLEDIGYIPENYILNPELVLTLPSVQTAASGLDALAQGIESYWSPRATDESRHWARLAIRLVSKHLLASYENPKSEILRLKMLEAANYSGRAINVTKTSICHAISYPLTNHYDIPHGIAVAHTLPFFMRYFGFRIIKPEQVEKIIERCNAKIRVEYDKDLIIKEALQSERAFNTPLKIDAKTIYDSLPADVGRPASHRTP